VEHPADVVVGECSGREEERGESEH
jgi:hypothetical protein